jgi:hypothetical protein
MARTVHAEPPLEGHVSRAANAAHRAIGVIHVD